MGTPLLLQILILLLPAPLPHGTFAAAGFGTNFSATPLMQ